MSGRKGDEWSVDVNIEPIRQPVPFVYQYGDCGACVLAAALGIGNDEAALRKVYAQAHGKPDHVDPLSCTEVEWALERYQIDGVVESWKRITPRPYLHELHYMPGWGWPGETMEYEWVHLLRTHLEAGYVGLTTVLSKGTGRYIHHADGKIYVDDADHWVMLTGIRSEWTPLPSGGSRLDMFVRMSDSRTSHYGHYWYEARQFLLRYGGLAVFYVRPHPMPVVRNSLLEAVSGNAADPSTSQ